LKLCPNCRGNLADFVDVCPYCGVATPVVQAVFAQGGWEPSPKNSGKALASLICGLLFICAPAAVAAIILGHLALNEIKRSAGRVTGRGLAIAGLIMGYLGIAFTLLSIVVNVMNFRTAFRQDVPANESAAIETMKHYSEAMKAYAAKCPEQGFPSSLTRLGPGNGDCNHAGLVDMKLAAAQPVKLGYTYKYTPGVLGGNKVTVFALVASPVASGITGNRFFFLDEEGVLRQSNSQIVGPNSEPVDDSGKFAE